jgi:hypothetical protein
MRDVQRRFGSLSTLALAAFACAVSAPTLTACKKGGGGKKSAAARWIDSPSPGTKDGNTIRIPKLGVQFEIPDTLYVYRQCAESSHSKQGAEGWVPIISCSSTNAMSSAFGDDDDDDDPWAAEDAEEASGVETIDLTVFVTHRTRPLDERSIAWFENMYKQNGFSIDEISFQHDYQKKSGIFARLHVMDQNTGTPTREIVQFMFPRDDVVFIARMEYPFGETRSVEQDWKYILWNFDLVGAAAAE